MQTELAPRVTPLASPASRGPLAAELRAVGRLSVPIVLSQLGTTGMNMMDTWMVAPLGASALAAVGLATSLHLSGLIVCTGVLAAMGPLVSQARAGGRGPRPARLLAAGLGLSLMLSAVLVALSLPGEAIGLLLGQDPATAAAAGSYVRALAWGVPPVLAFLACRQFLEGLGMPRPATAITFLGLLVNYFGNEALIPRLGVDGSAWATTLVRWAMLLAAVLYLAARRRSLGLRGWDWRPRLHLVAALARVGLPAGAVQGFEVCFFAFGAIMMGWISPLALGTHQIAINLAGSTFMAAMGVSIAGSIRVGHGIGAREPASVRAAVVATYLLVTAAMGVFALLFLLVPQWLVGLYSDDPQVLAMGVSLLGVAALFQIFDGAQVAGISVLRGAADTRVPMLLAAVSYWAIGAPSGYWLAFRLGMGPPGIWTGMVVALGVAALLLGWRVRRVLWYERPEQAPAPIGE